MVIWLAAWLLLAAAAIAAPAWAAGDPPGRVGRVTDQQGQSWFFDNDAGEWVTLERNRPLTTGDRLAVDGSARLELRIGSTVVRLAGGSELEITRLDDARIELYLHDGSVAVRVRSPEVAREVEVASAVGRFSLNGPGHFRVDRRDEGNTATAWLGDVHFDGDDSALDITAGRGAEFWHEGTNNATHYSWVDPASDEFADWTARANREDDRLAVAPYVSPEMTGAEDLNRYGTWETTPDYGPVWYPTTVVAGWAPYRYGHWVWVQPWGWSWVDYAPWGFAPFHYGRWVYFGGRWCWAPGQRVLRPVYSPAMVAWVSSVPPGKTPWPYVGWVPLAPHEPYYPNYASGGSYWRAVNAAQMKLFPPGTPRRPPVSPSLYANQGVSGAVSVVPGNALVPRRPIAPAVAQVDPTVRNTFATQPTRTLVPPPGVARPIALPGPSATERPRTPPPPPGSRPGGRGPSPAVTTQPGVTPPDARRAPRTVQTPSPTMPAPPRATIAPPGSRMPQPAGGEAGASPRGTAPIRQGGPAPATPQTPAVPPAPTAPSPAAQPTTPRSPTRPDPGDAGTPRTPGRSSALPGQAVQARATPVPTRQPERVAPPVRAPESHLREARRGPGTPAAQARVRVPEWHHQPNRAQMR